jgi:drug/metabolite transporter (DMT)-like permease
MPRSSGPVTGHGFLPSGAHLTVCVAWPRSTFFNYNAYSWAGSIVSPGIISVYSTLQPVGTAVLSLVFLHLKATAGEILCGILVIIGLLLTVAARQIESKLQKALHHGGQGRAVDDGVPGGVEDGRHAGEAGSLNRN